MKNQIRILLLLMILSPLFLCHEDARVTNNNSKEKSTLFLDNSNKKALSERISIGIAKQRLLRLESSSNDERELDF